MRLKPCLGNHKLLLLISLTYPITAKKKTRETPSKPNQSKEPADSMHTPPYNLILSNKRYTLALKYIRQGETLKDTIDFLLEEVESIGFKIKGLYLDREFFTVDVINYLQERNTPFIIPCVKRGRSGGIRNLFVGRKKLLHRIYHAFRGWRSHLHHPYHG